MKFRTKRKIKALLGEALALAIRILPVCVGAMVATTNIVDYDPFWVALGVSWMITPFLTRS